MSERLTTWLSVARKQCFDCLGSKENCWGVPCEVCGGTGTLPPVVRVEEVKSGAFLTLTVVEGKPASITVPAEELDGARKYATFVMSPFEHGTIGDESGH
jgi:hypothetical protein